MIKRYDIHMFETAHFIARPLDQFSDAYLFQGTDTYALMDRILGVFSFIPFEEVTKFTMPYYLIHAN